VICNTGVSLTPTVDGKLYHFENPGIYDGLFLMADRETSTFWNHITGEALHGELVGHSLPVSNLLQMNVQQALEMDPDIEIAISTYDGGGVAGGEFARDVENADMGARFAGTLGVEDERRPRMELGLGVWTDQIQRYYAVATVRARGGAVIDEVDGRNLLVYLDPISSTPAAIYVDGDEARVEGRDIHLSDRTLVRAGTLVGPDGASIDVERPLQLFTRWYGFSRTFLDPEIFGDE
jgi:hypothetical protein